MNQPLKLSVIIVLLLIAAGTLCAQPLSYTDLNIKGAGARASGIAGAFIGLADDATDISWNTAGLTQLERMEVSAVLQLAAQSLSMQMPN